MTSTNATRSTCSASDLACNGCALALATMNACSSQIGPTITAIADADLAKCLCYNPVSAGATDFVWVPKQFDVPFSACPIYASSAFGSSEGAAMTSEVGFCSRQGNVLHATTTATTTLALTSLLALSGSLALSTALASGTSVTGAQTSVTASSTAGAGHGYAAEASGVAVSHEVW